MATDPPMSGVDEVRLSMPATPEFVRLARLTAAGLASRLGFSYDEVEDLRIAVDELCYLLVGHGGGVGSMALTYTVDDTLLVIEGAGAGAGVDLSPLSERILEAVTDGHEIRRDGGDVRFRLERRRSD